MAANPQSADYDQQQQNQRFWQGISRLPEPAGRSFLDAGQALSGYLGEPPVARRLQFNTTPPPTDMPWWEKIFYYAGQSSYNQAVAQAAAGEQMVEGAKWLGAALQGDFNRSPTTGQVIVGGLISMIPVVDQACDVRDIIANCITLSDEKERDNNEHWIALGLTCFGFVPEIGSAVKTVAKTALKNSQKLLDLLKVMEHLEANFAKLGVRIPWGRAPVDWLKKFDWEAAARAAAEGAKKAFRKAQELAQSALRYAVGAIKRQLENLVKTFAVISARIGDAMSSAARKIKEKIDQFLKREKQEAGNYGGAPGGPNRHGQNDKPPPKGPGKPKTMDPHKPKCFKPGDDLKSSWKGETQKLEKEFYEQLKAQEAGLNKLSVGEYLDNQAKFEAIGRGNGAAQAAARKKLGLQIQDSIEANLLKGGASPANAERMAAGRTEEIMSSLAALHDPDMSAGGYDTVQRLGNTKVNSSLGSQWAKEDRLAEMDNAARKALQEHGPDAKMNVTLERCK